jgi:hypothetical protein
VGAFMGKLLTLAQSWRQTQGKANLAFLPCAALSLPRLANTKASLFRKKS